MSGGNEGTFPPFTYSPATSSGSLNDTIFPVDTFFFQTLSGPPFRQLRLTPVMALSNAGGTVALNVGVTPNEECFNCSPFRSITSGSLRAIPRESTVGVPVLGGLGSVGFTFLVVALVLLGLRSIRGSRRTFV